MQTMVNLRLPHPVYHTEAIICFQEKLLPTGLEAHLEDFKPCIKRIKPERTFFIHVEAFLSLSIYPKSCTKLE